MLTSTEIGLDTNEIGLDCIDLYINYTYHKSVGDQTLCKNGFIHPESEPARVEISSVSAPFVGDILPILSEESINTIEAHLLEYLESNNEFS